MYFSITENLQADHLHKKISAGEDGFFYHLTG